MEYKIFEVAYECKDEEGMIVKSIKVVATSEENAISQVIEVSHSYEVYGAVDSTKLRVFDLDN